MMRSGQRAEDAQHSSGRNYNNNNDDNNNEVKLADSLINIRHNISTELENKILNEGC